ncbi:poly(ethylene terephthalate) hydrolase family protein [Nannocystis bainbridge]|uniref:Alpha/beta hydrolase family protein n=1 Tax=Nannocystis bainbridge TaxID=2995303 RepID=A0ABT5DPQ5_9BACT|nr:hypothetical protein [Nannocystis bainbridge]MDC0715630.1 hypothetical protein [Nannocystis bainbridge]
MLFTKSPSSLLSSLLCTVALTAGCGELEDSFADEDDAIALRPVLLPSDPATVTTHVPCVDADTFDGTEAVIRYPRGLGNCLTTVPNSPLVLVMHGTGYPHDSYDYLLDHLAANGFIVVSTAEIASNDTVTAYGDAALAVEGFLDALLDEWALAGFIDPTRLALVGHSKGGKLARYVADQLKGGADPWTVRAVVSLSGNGRADMQVEADMTPALLILQAAEDSDVEPDANFEVYDLAGTEGAIPPAGPSGLTKVMKLIEGGHHHRFSQSLGLHAQAHVSKGYLLAFLAAHVRNNWTWYEAYIRGDAIPYGWPERVVTQYSDGVQRDVVDNFEDGLVGASAMDGAVTVSNAVTSIFDLEAAGDAFQGETLALEMSGNAEGSSITWFIPEEHRDTADFAWLSFRIAQVDGSASSYLRFQISNDNVWSAEQIVGDHGTIATPMEMCPPSQIPYGPGAACWPSGLFHHLGTVRIPLAEFGAHDDIDRVRLIFRGRSVEKTYLLDSLEFSGDDDLP